jgi:DNA-binding transcriptional ArsR family regulator
MRRLSQEHVSLIANRARALAEPARVRILERLSRGDQAVGQLAAALGMQQSTASKHLQVLFRAGLVGRRRSASAVIYSIAADELIAWCRYLAHRQLSGSTAHEAAMPCMNFSRAAGRFRAAHRREPRYRREAR